MKFSSYYLSQMLLLNPLANLDEKQSSYLDIIGDYLTAEVAYIQQLRPTPTPTPITPNTSPLALKEAILQLIDADPITAKDYDGNDVAIMNPYRNPKGISKHILDTYIDVFNFIMADVLIYYNTPNPAPPPAGFPTTPLPHPLPSGTTVPLSTTTINAYMIVQLTPKSLTCDPVAIMSPVLLYIINTWAGYLSTFVFI